MRKKIFNIILLLFCLSETGCALINLPLQVAGQAIKVVSKMPLPPPGVF